MIKGLWLTFKWNLRKGWTEWLQKALGRQLGVYNDLEHKARIQAVEAYFLSSAPVFNKERFEGKTFCFGGRWNYFLTKAVPDDAPLSKVLEALPKFDIVVPEIPLYVCVPDVSSASWEEARTRGVARPVWEAQQGLLHLLEEAVPNIPTVDPKLSPKILVVRWSESVNHHALHKRVMEIIS